MEAFGKLRETRDTQGTRKTYGKPKVDIEGTPKGNLRDTSRTHPGNLRET